MKRFLAILKAAAAATAAVSAADVAGFVNLLPPDTAKTLAIGLSACAVVGHVLEALTKSIEPKDGGAQ